MKELLILITVALVGCSYDYKVPIDTDVIKYQIKHPIIIEKKDIIMKTTNLVEITGEPTVTHLTRKNCPSIHEYEESEIFQKTSCSTQQKKNYTCCRVTINSDKPNCMIYLCHTKDSKNRKISCMGLGDKC